jgi:hypothetical protein
MKAEGAGSKPTLLRRDNGFTATSFQRGPSPYVESSSLDWPKERLAKSAFKTKHVLAGLLASRLRAQKGDAASVISTERPLAHSVSKCNFQH